MKQKVLYYRDELKSPLSEEAINTMVNTSLSGLYTTTTAKQLLIIPSFKKRVDNFAKGKRTSLGACFGHALYGFIRAYIFQLGFIDGWSGLYSSMQHFIYTMMKYLKLYELQIELKKRI